MGYTLEAVLMDSGAANFRHGLPSVPLPNGPTLLPITDEVLDGFFSGPADSSLSGSFWKLNGALEAFVVEVSWSGCVAYVEADFFGGWGMQVAAVWQAGRLILGPERSAGVGAINHALRRLGVPRTSGRDEFDEVGLGRVRRTEDWGGG